MRGASLMLLLFVGIAVLAPATSLGQSAGDEQYVDPFQDQEGQGGSGGTGGGGQNTGGGQTDSGTGTSGDSGGDTGETGGTVEPTPPPSEQGGGFGASASGSSASGADVLPRTGLSVALTALLGAVSLAGGTALRRRVSPGRPRPPA
jgi:hypothetical protein